ncbi:hypothetical protein ACIGCK_01890 [Microbacterium sp. NPDC078428]|uniref:hypothetical protein n=1 Tax=Microbacterium sp. NPDC078428 TaxID=3364190 RepID=UPI0037C8AD86
MTLVLSSNLLLFVLLQLAGQVAGIAVSYHALFRRYRGPRHRIRVQDVVETYRTGFYGLVSSAVTTAYQNSPLLIAAAVIPNVVTVFAMCDRLYRIAQLSLVPVTQIAQGYVPAASSPLELVRRMRVALFASIMCGVVAWVAFAGLARPASLLLSDSQIAVPPAAAVFLGASVAITLLSSVSSRACLVAIGRVGAVAASAVAGAAVAMVGVYVGAVLWGVDGAALGVLAAEAVAFFVLISTLIRGAKQLLSGATEGNHEA